LLSLGVAAGRVVISGLSFILLLAAGELFFVYKQIIYQFMTVIFSSECFVPSDCLGRSFVNVMNVV